MVESWEGNSDRMITNKRVMKASDDQVDDAAEAGIKLEIDAKQHQENLKIQDALKKQEGWRYLIEKEPDLF